MMQACDRGSHRIDLCPFVVHCRLLRLLVPAMPVWGELDPLVAGLLRCRQPVQACQPAHPFVIHIDTSENRVTRN